MSDRIAVVALNRNRRDGAEPKDEAERLTWEVLDTTYDLLREYAVRVTIAEIRSLAAQQGLTVPSDEELFQEARKSGGPEAPTSYEALAPDVELAALGLHGAWIVLLETVRAEAAQVLGGGVE